MALPLILTEIPQIKKLKINKFALIIGSLLPDIIDKPLLFLGLGTGRSVSHSLIFLLISFLFIHFFTKKNWSISAPYLAAISLHLLLDLPDIPYFYPFISYEFPLVEVAILHWFNKILTDPIVIITEITGFLFIIFIIMHNKLYHVNVISNYLKGNHHFLTNSQKIKT